MHEDASGRNLVLTDIQMAESLLTVINSRKIIEEEEDGEDGEDGQQEQEGEGEGEEEENQHLGVVHQGKEVSFVLCVILLYLHYFPVFLLMSCNSCRYDVTTIFSCIYAFIMHLRFFVAFTFICCIYM